MSQDTSIFIANNIIPVHTAGTPGAVKTPVALPDSQSQISISWLYPLDHNTLDPVLVRYQAYYSQGTTFDQATATQGPVLLPVLLDGQLSADGVVQTRLTGLEPGTTYTVTLRAIGPTTFPSEPAGDLDGDRALVSTFGTGESTCLPVCLLLLCEPLQKGQHLFQIYVPSQNIES